MKKQVKMRHFGVQLPPLMQLNDGTPVKTASDWQRRREELKAILQTHVYGQLPPAPTTAPRIQMGEPFTAVHGAPSAVLTRFVTQPFPDSDFGILVDWFRPHGKPDGACGWPVIICGDGCWQRITPAYVELVTSRGYSLCVFDRTTVFPDRWTYLEDAPGVPTRPVTRDCVLTKRYPELDFGAVAGWAWGFHRVVDALLQFPEIDPKRVAVTGHSRGGKAALLAGAMDERIAMVFPNGSGTGGAGSLLFQGEGAEPIHMIVKNFPTWFSPKFADYVGHEADLPFDSHFLKALCAPRPLLCTEGMADLWANLEGLCVTHAAARDVYAFCGQNPAFLGQHFRTGPHLHSLEDWGCMLDFCDAYYRGTALPWDPLYCPFEGILDGTQVPSGEDSAPQGE